MNINFTLISKLNFSNFNLRELEAKAIDTKYQNNKLIKNSFSTNKSLFANTTLFSINNFF